MTSAKQSKRTNGGRGQKQARPAISSSDMLAAIPDMIFRIDGDGRYLEFKPAKGMEPYTPPEAFLGRRMHDVLPKDVADGGLEAIQAAIQSNEALAFIYDLPMGDGSHRYEARVVPLNADEALIIVRDLTENALRTSSVTPPDYSLSKREMVVLTSVALGLTDKQIAHKLGISPDTVRKHVASVRRKMGASSRTEASVRAVREGLLP
jgi:DNA-binding CsgD family transcriptional regulator